MNIDYRVEDNRFISRAAAIILNKDKTKVLLFKVDDGREFFTLPGGRIEFYEDSLTTIKREIKEELGFEMDFKLISVQENFLTHKNVKITNYVFCYKGIYDGEISEEVITCLDDDNQYFYWVPINKINNYKILPESTYELINNEDLKHNIEYLDERNV